MWSKGQHMWGGTKKHDTHEVTFSHLKGILSSMSYNNNAKKLWVHMDRSEVLSQLLTHLPVSLVSQGVQKNSVLLHPSRFSSSLITDCRAPVARLDIRYLKRSTPWWCQVFDQTAKTAFDMCLSVKTRFLTLPLSAHPHFLSFICSWHFLSLSLCLPFLCPFSLHHPILPFSLISPSCAWRPPYLYMGLAVLH